MQSKKITSKSSFDKRKMVKKLRKKEQKFEMLHSLIFQYPKISSLIYPSKLSESMHAFVEYIEEKGLLFQDPKFPPDITSLYGPNPTPEVLKQYHWFPYIFW
jgi:hypothetical protein